MLLKFCNCLPRFVVIATARRECQCRFPHNKPLPDFRNLLLLLIFASSDYKRFLILAMPANDTESPSANLADLENHSAFQREQQQTSVSPFPRPPSRSNSKNYLANTSAIPRTQFGDITNMDATPRNHVSTHALREFTPLLKSAVRGSARKNAATTTGIPPLPNFQQRSPGLPDSEYEGPEFSASMDEEVTRTSIRGPEPIEESRNETPVVRRNHVTGDNVLTLREQEAVSAYACCYLVVQVLT